MEVLVVICWDIRINVIAISIMVFLVFGIKPNYVANEDKKRKEKSLETILGRDQDSNSKLSHLAVISCQKNLNLRHEEAPQAKTT